MQQETFADLHTKLASGCGFTSDEDDQLHLCDAPLHATDTSEASFSGKGLPLMIPQIVTLPNIPTSESCYSEVDAVGLTSKPEEEISSYDGQPCEPVTDASVLIDLEGARQIG